MAQYYLINTTNRIVFAKDTNDLVTKCGYTIGMDTAPTAIICTYFPTNVPMKKHPSDTIAKINLWKH
ncbi:MAG: hypothetical protein ACK5KP_05925 [Paludibacteraceae bacterium]